MAIQAKVSMAQGFQLPMVNIACLIWPTISLRANAGLNGSLSPALDAPTLSVLAWPTYG